MKLLLVTGNQGKLNEWRRLISSGIELENVDIDLDEIQSIDPEEIVIDKVKRAYEIVKRPIIVEDVSAGLDSMGGLPGPFIKFFIKEMGEDALYRLSKDNGEKAKVCCTVAYYDGTNLFTVKGEVEGSVVPARGENGFGFDKVFVPNGMTKTYGEMTPYEKDKVSHRSKAAKMLESKLGKVS